MVLQKKPVVSVLPQPESVGRCESTHDVSQCHEPKHKSALVTVRE